MSEPYEDFEHDGDPAQWLDTGPLKTSFSGSPLLFDLVTEPYEDFENDGSPAQWPDTGPIKSAFIGGALSFDISPYAEPYEDFEEEWPELVPHAVDGNMNVFWKMDGANPFSVIDSTTNGHNGNTAQVQVLPGKRVNGRRAAASTAWLYNGMVTNLSTAASLAYGTFEFFVQLHSPWSFMIYWMTYPIMLGWMARRFITDDAQISVEVDTAGDLLRRFKGVTINLGPVANILQYNAISMPWFPVILQWDTVAQWVWFQAGNSFGKAPTGGALLNPGTPFWWYNLGFSGWKTNPVAPTGLEYDEFIHSTVVKYPTW